MDTSEGCINRVAKYLSNCPNDTIDTEGFCSACYASNVDLDSFSQHDLDQLQYKLKVIGH